MDAFDPFHDLHGYPAAQEAPHNRLPTSRKKHLGYDDVYAKHLFQQAEYAASRQSSDGCCCNYAPALLLVQHVSSLATRTLVRANPSA